MQTAVIIIMGLLLLMLVSVPAWLMWFAAASMLSTAYAFPSIRMTLVSIVLSLITVAGTGETLATPGVGGLMFFITCSIIWSAGLIPITALVLFVLKRKNMSNGRV